MYSKSKLARKYLSWWLKASHSKGHGTHSPFVYEFIRHILNDDKDYPEYKKIEALRKKLLKDNRVIEVEDFGAGSAIIKTQKRIVKDIAKTSLKPKKFAQLLFRIVNHINPTVIIELGTSLGITTVYLAKGNEKATVDTFEGSAEIAKIAQENFKELSIENIRTHIGNFDSDVPLFFNEKQIVDMAFVDGNHRYQPTLDYFNMIQQHLSPMGFIIFDDIHWSKEMEQAWEEIKENRAVSITIDLFFIGIVFFKTGCKEKQHFRIRY